MHLREQTHHTNTHTPTYTHSQIILNIILSAKFNHSDTTGRVLQPFMELPAGPASALTIVSLMSKQQAAWVLFTSSLTWFSFLYSNLFGLKWLRAASRRAAAAGCKSLLYWHAGRRGHPLSVSGFVWQLPYVKTSSACCWLLSFDGTEILSIML